MPKTKISEFSATPGNNTDIDGINIAEGCAPSGINDAIRELMAQLKDFQAGTAGDSFNGPVGTTTAAAGAFTTLSASSTVSGAGFSTYLASPPAIGGTAAAAGSFTTLTTSSTVTHNGGTANGVAYLNGSKVLTTGSALTFDGQTLTNTRDTPILTLNDTTAGNIALRLLSTGGLTYIQSGVSAGAFSSIAFTANGGGSEQMRLTSTGLGIGTSSPSTKLEVSGSAAVARVSGTAGTVPQLSLSSAGVVNWTLRSNNDGGSDFTIYQDSTQRLKIDSSGNLGIGTSSPGSLWSGANKLVVGSGSAAAGLTIYTSTSTAGTLAFGDGTTGSDPYVGYVQYTHTDNTMLFGTNGTTKATLDSSGNLGLGVTPSAWRSGDRALDIGSTASLVDAQSANTRLYNNTFVAAGGTNTYKITAAASYYDQGGGVHRWFNAASGTAGNAITFTQAMTLDASGNLGVGTTSPNARLEVLGGTNNAEYLRVGSPVSDRALRFSSFAVNGTNNIGHLINAPGLSGTDGTLAFATNSTERARITSGGDLLVGTSSGQVAATVVAYRSSAATACVGPWNAATSGDNLFVVFNTEATATQRGSIDYNRAGGLTRYNTTSDYRAKDIIGPTQNTGSTIDALKIYEGVMKGATQSRPMMIAHEAQAVVPFCVSGEKDEVNEDGTPKYQQMDHASLVPLLIAEIQSLRQRVAALEAK